MGSGPLGPGSGRDNSASDCDFSTQVITGASPRHCTGRCFMERGKSRLLAKANLANRRAMQGIPSTSRAAQDLADDVQSWPWGSPPHAPFPQALEAFEARCACRDATSSAGAGDAVDCVLGAVSQGFLRHWLGKTIRARSIWRGSVYRWRVQVRLG
jgi:hypothetical protein